ncbi:RBBP9/YdeN family alpha/beta hydrolase [Priestia megaterium]|uniref:RBBP9/YdeN family alpha/beta hydrolase n=1 Tax=Priestia megaterium TaxID=1404 RepID=UPI002E1AC2A5|nr:alpha/beta hydrolase [Priestia megaterium]MED4267851.1 alpha/beta hydrolase [Priestia megaterium]MED4278649.1 alpha/beta hydrolase [Priestia megaterium]MED4319086.1 alpha/beta hydrolase [Priestia megaterium]
MRKQVYIIHGYGASPASHWFPWLKEKLMADDHQVSVLHMPNSSAPEKGEWLETLANKIKNLDDNTYFVAHSLGSITLLNYLEQLNPLPGFGGFVLVSGFSERLSSLSSLDPFTVKEVDYQKIISATNSRAVIAARDDYIVPFQLSQNLSKQLDTSFYPIEKGGHFLEDDGFIAFQLVYDILNNMMKTV